MCDPVQGDDGRLYCKPEMPAAYRDIILPLATVLIPNQYEAELLSGMSIHSESDALAACRFLHSKGPSTVIISSLDLPGSSDWVTIIASTIDAQQQESSSFQTLKLRVPRIDAYFTGTGDLFSALILAWLSRSPHDLKFAVEKAVAGLQAVLLDTVEHSKLFSSNSNSSAAGGGGGDDRTAAVCAARELRLIQNQDKLIDPEIQYYAVPCASPWPDDS